MFRIHLWVILAKTYFMLKKIKCIIIFITLEGIEKIKNRTNDNKTVWTITRACEWAKIHFSSPESPI